MNYSSLLGDSRRALRTAVAASLGKKRGGAAVGRALALLVLSAFAFAAAMPPAAASGPVMSGLAGGSDGVARLAWANPDGVISYWRTTASSPVAVSSYGPYAGWSPVGIATGGNNVPRFLWNNVDGTMSLWNLTESSGAFSFQNYGPFAGWKAVAISAGGNNVPRVMWTNTNGAESLWSVNAAGDFVHSENGPYAGWTASFLAVGPNNAPRILWVNTSGVISLWGNADTGSSNTDYGPYAGWSPISMVVDSTNSPRIFWSHPADGTVSLWKVGADTSFTFQNFVAPAGFSPKGVTAGPAGTVSLVWAGADKTAQIWVINADGGVGSKTVYPSAYSLVVAPSPVVGGTSSIGTVALNAPAPSGGVSVALASDSALAKVPPVVLVPAGATGAAFTVTTSNPAGPGAATANISATSGGATQTAALSITYTAPQVALVSFSLSPISVPGGTSSVGTVALNTPAPSGGVSVALASDNALANVPPVVLVPAGATGAAFTVTTSNLSGPGSATAYLSAAYSAATLKAALGITYAPSVPTTGVYRLTTKGQQGLALDVLGFGNGNGTTVQLYAAGQTCNQQWLVEKQADGTFKLHPYSGVGTNQVLDDNNGGIANGNKVTTYQDNGNDAQRWFFLDIGGGFYRIIPKNAGIASAQTLDMSGAEGAASGSTTAIYPYYGGSNQVFRLDPPGAPQPTPGVYRISTRGNPNLSLDVVGFGNGDGTNVQLFTANQTSNQQWLVGTTGGNLYSVAAYSAANSLQMLDDAGGATANGTNVTTYTDNGAPAQRWYFEDVGGGYSRLVPSSAGAASGQTLDVRNGNSAALGDTLNIFAYYGGDNQVFKLNDPGPSQILVNPKKGMTAKEWAGWGIHNSWYYTWGADEPTDAPPGTEFVPMEWGYYGGDSTAWLNGRKAQAGVKNFLAFNEPDHTDQANLSVASALDGFQYLSNLGIPVSSPACADDNGQWFSDFMAGASARNYRIDFIAVHCYVRDPYQFLSYIDNLHNRYWQHPLWITEFAPADWSGTNPVSVDEAKNFMRIVVPALNSRWYVARYAWYTGADPGGTWTLSSAGLVNKDSSLTDMGLLYGRM